MEFDIEKDKQEAIAAGERAIESLRRAKEEIEKARGFGLVDIFGGGLLSTVMKHNKMDKAEYWITQAKIDLNKFSKELKDVSSAADINIDIGNFGRVADIVFDNAFVDIMISSKLRDASEQIDDAIRHVGYAIKKLKYVHKD